MAPGDVTPGDMMRVPLVHLGAGGLVFGDPGYGGQYQVVKTSSGVVGWGAGIVHPGVRALGVVSIETFG